MAIKSLPPAVKMLNTSVASQCASAGTTRVTGRKRVDTRKRVAERDGFKCRVCGRLTLRGEVDHIIPLHLGGQESDNNRQWLCVECHAAKTATENNARGGGGANL